MSETPLSPASTRSVPDTAASTPSLREAKASGARWGLAGFVEVVNGLVAHYLPASRSDNVKLRAAFNPRLVRYYTTFGLIAPPEREGKEARYHFGHLVQALVIRRLLFEGYTAPALLKMLAGKKEAEFEAMLAGGVSTAAAPLTRAGVTKDAPAAAPSEDLRLVRGVMAAQPIARSPLSGAVWRRVEIAPGLELHVCADFARPATQAEQQSLLLTILESLPTTPI